MEPYNYILQVPGKQVREKLIHVRKQMSFHSLRIKRKMWLWVAKVIAKKARNQLPLR